ncbi:copper radical oxidase [Pluteus cervinus]|uniref:Copper radical oxidase n=1 Tax=Pluteus cervinus TaxID=181527 RepID=A0ACD3AXY3_9AGAR|nr:copper radical oxidase [Pluteus cervinus]
MQGLLPPLLASYFLTNVGFALAQTATVLPAQSQPTRTGTPGSFEIIGESLVSAQQIFLGTLNTVYFVDKVENNPTTVEGHSAWASEWNLAHDKQRPMDALTNTFCAGGNVLGNGTWVNVGGNQAVTTGGVNADNNAAPYFDSDGRQSIRLLDACDDGSCNWVLSPDAIGQRWYPTLETLEDGSVIIIGGCRNGGYVNDQYQDNPTYEFFPPRGAPVTLDILQRTLPANLYPLTWLLPSGNLFIQSNWATILFDYKAGTETPLDDVPDAVRVYPASAGNVMLPLTPGNNYTATLLFCGGSNIEASRWLDPSFIKTSYPASDSCVMITPDQSGKYVDDDPFPEARVMANFILLPDGRVLNLNGAASGTAGYGTEAWADGESYATDPVLAPAIYNPNAPGGNKWSRDGLQSSKVPRMYHSSALLLPDGSVLVSGSNPNADYNLGVPFPTENRTELFYPSYYNQRRPEPQGILSQISYGGPNFDIVLSAEDLFGNVSHVDSAKVVLIRPGFSTHAINMGQRYVELASSYTGFQENNTAILHVNQLPPNPALLAPGPLLAFVVVNGVPSVGVQVMVGNGQVGKQPVLPVADLPQKLIVPSSKSSGNGNAALPVSRQRFSLVSLPLLFVALAAFFL